MRAIFVALAVCVLSVCGGSTYLGAQGYTTICKQITQAGAVVAPCPSYPFRNIDITQVDPLMVDNPTVGRTASVGYSPNVTLMSNATEWQTSYRAFCDNTTPTPAAPCPYNVVLPANPAYLLTQNGGSATVLAAMAAHSDLSLGLMNNTTGVNSGDFATYLASTSDPAVTLTCTNYCWNGTSAGTSGTYTLAHVPVLARSSANLCPGDCQMEIVEPDGTGYSIYGMSAQYAGGSTISAIGFAETNVQTGNGVDPCYTSLSPPGNGGSCTANGGVIMAHATGLRTDEITAGVIPHALVVEVNRCTSGQVYPGSTGYECAGAYGYTGVPIGARVIVNLTDAQIDGTASNLRGYVKANTAAWERVLLHQLRDYGLIMGPTCGGGCAGANFGMYTQAEQITASGGTPPTTTFDWTSPAGGAGGVGTFPNPWTPGGLDFTQASTWLILDPCYSLETCSDSVN